jgi:hypothetical protein
MEFMGSPLSGVLLALELLLSGPPGSGHMRGIFGGDFGGSWAAAWKRSGERARTNSPIPARHPKRQRRARKLS